VLARTLLAAISLSAVIAAAGCGSGGSSGSSAPASTPPTTSTPVSSAPVSSAPTTPQDQNLVIDNKIRAELVAAGAAVHKLTPKDYLGLVAGETYYASVPARGTYWAGAGLRPSPKSMQAQIDNQDDGAYMVFERHGDGPWRVWETGIPGDPEFTCSVKVPAAVLKLWAWKPGTCHPPKDLN